MGAIFSRQHSSRRLFETVYSVNIKSPDDSVLPNGDITFLRDGFVIGYTVQNNTESYYYVPEENEWKFHSTTYGSVQSHLFYASRDQVLPRFVAYGYISLMLDRANIPLRAQPLLAIEIYQAIVSIGSDPSYAAPRIIPMLVEVTAWECDDISDEMRFVAELEEQDIAAENEPMAAENEPKATPAARFALELLEKVNIDAVDYEKGVCTICLDHFVEGAEVIYMPCKHMFHGECITNWLKNSNICPLCRFQLPVHDPNE